MPNQRENLEIQKQINSAMESGTDVAKSLAKLLKSQLKSSKKINKTIEDRVKNLNSLMDIGSEDIKHSEKAIKLQSKIKDIEEKIQKQRDKSGKFIKGNKLKQLQTDKAAFQAELKREETLADVSDVTKEKADIMMNSLEGMVNKLNNIPVVGKLITKSFGLTEENMGQIRKNLGEILQGNGEWKDLMKGTKGLSAGTLMALVGSSIAIGGIVILWKVFSKILKSSSEVTDKLGQKFGVMGSQDLTGPVMAQRQQVQALGKDVDDISDVMSELSENFGFGVVESANMASNILDSSMAMGLSNEEGAKLYGTLMKIGDLSFDQAEKLAESTYQLAQANDVAPSAVMKDIANNTEVFAKFTKDGGGNIAKAAVQARKLGISLSDVADIASSLLDFQSSLSAEVEASIMLGRQLNFQKARELALTGDMSGMMDNVLEQLGGEAEWNKLNMLQRESIAKSLGKDVATMSKLVGEHGKLGKQKSFGDMMGEDALSTLTSIINKIKSMGAVIVQNVAPHIEKMVDKFKDWLENSGGMETMVGYANGLAQGIVFAFKAIVKIMNALPEIIKLFLILKTISIASAIASIWKGAMESSSKIPFIGAAIGIAAAGVATGMMISSINSVGDMISPSDGKLKFQQKKVDYLN